MKFIKADYFKKVVVKFKVDWNDMADDSISSGDKHINKIVKSKVVYDNKTKCYCLYGIYDDNGNGIPNPDNGKGF